MSYKILAFIGEAGAGKDKIFQSYLSLSKRTDLYEIISCTTRPKREGEAEGVNYYYLTNEQFANKIWNNEMLEASSFNGWAYGTSYDSLRSGLLNVGVFNPDGIEALLNRKDIDLVVIRVRVSDKTRLIRQLQRETNPDIEEIIRRYSADKIDFAFLDFDYITLDNEENRESFQSVVDWIDLQLEGKFD